MEKDLSKNLFPCGFNWLIYVAGIAPCRQISYLKSKLCQEEKILIIEDMDLLNLNPGTKVNTVIVSPLRFENSDGAPVTIFYN